VSLFLHLKFVLFLFLFVTLSSHHHCYFPPPIIYPYIQLAWIFVYHFHFRACATHNAYIPILMHGLHSDGCSTHFQRTTVPSEIVTIAMPEGGPSYWPPYTLVARLQNMALPSRGHFIGIETDTSLTSICGKFISDFLLNCPSATLPTLLAQQYPHHSFDTSPHLMCIAHIR
jgi:hypothetical protein